MKKVCSLLLSLLVVFTLALPAYASGGSLTIHKKDSFTCSPGISTATDLFDDQFKNVMPGDKITGYITINSGFSFHEDSIKVYMRALTHSNGDNKPVIGENAVSMNDFLSKLHLKVYNESKGGVEIFRGKASELDGLKSNVYLGSFRRGGKIKLKVVLEVPIELGNDYANRKGEVDWLFTIEAYDDPSSGSNYKTGDYIMIAVCVMLLSAGALALIFWNKKRKK